MKHVHWKTVALSALLVGTLSGCLSTPEVSVSSLGKKLPAPSLKGLNPFEQDIDTVGYVQVQGTCDSRIGLIYLSFDNNVWHQVPAQPNLTGLSLPASTVNDNDCSSDGAFSIYLTKTDLLNIWGITTGSGGSDVKYLYIKGETLIGDTETLTIVDAKDPANGGGTNAASAVILEKVGPSAAAGVNKCGSFQASIVTSASKPATHTVRINFGINMTHNSSTALISAYETWEDCEAGTNAKSSFGIAAGDYTKQIIYRFPASTVGDIPTFQIANPSALTAGPAKPVKLMDPSGMDRWFSLGSSPYQIYKNICYRLDVTSKDFGNGDNAYYTDKFSVSSPNSKVQFYSSASCSAAATEITFTNPTMPVYVKYIPAAGDAEEIRSFLVKIIGSASNVKTYATATFNFNYDTTDKYTATKLTVLGPQKVATGTCMSLEVATLNDNKTPLPVTANLTLSVKANGAYTDLYTDNYCTMAVNASNAVINSGKRSVPLFFKPMSAGSVTITAAANGMSGANLLITANSVPSSLQIQSMNWTANQCTQVTVGLLDGAGTAMTAPTSIPLIAEYTINGTTNFIYPNVACGTPLASSSITFMQGSAATVFYVPTSTIGYSGQISVRLDNGYTGSLTPAYATGTFISP